ncbi:hypothetical protein ACWEN4_03830 [Streptomyces violaceorubidus]
MPRKYTVSAAVIERNRKAVAARESLDNYIRKIVDRAPELTDEQIARLRPLLARVSGGQPE